MPNSPSQFVPRICGRPFPSDEESFIFCVLLLYLAHPSTFADSVQFHTRVNSLHMTYLFGDRRSIETLAIVGFSTIAQGIGCRSCGAAICQSRINDFIRHNLLLDLWSDHNADCQYRRLYAWLFIDPHRERRGVISFFKHLRREWKRTMTTVALELDFKRSLILFAYARKYLQDGEGFNTAGELVDLLLDLESEEWPWLDWDMTAILTSSAVSTTVPQLNEDGFPRRFLISHRLHNENDPNMLNGCLSCAHANDSAQFKVRLDWVCLECGHEDDKLTAITCFRCHSVLEHLFGNIASMFCSPD